MYEHIHRHIHIHRIIYTYTYVEICKHKHKHILERMFSAGDCIWQRFSFLLSRDVPVKQRNALFGRNGH